MDILHYATRIDSIRDLVNNFQLLQGEFHQTTKKEILIERSLHFINGLSLWTNFGFTWFDPQTGLFDLVEVLKEPDRVFMEQLLDQLIESGSFASSLQLSRVATFAIEEKQIILSPIRSGHDIKGVFIGISGEKIEQNREFELHFLTLAMNSLGAAIRRVESTDKLSITNVDLGELILKKVAESEEARMFAVATNQRIIDFLNLYHNEVYNSLNGVLGFAQLMMETVVSAEQRESMEFILKSGNHLKKITSDSQKSRVVIDGVLSVDLRSVDIERFWQNFNRATNELFKEKQRTVIWKSHFPRSFHLTLDEIRLRQLLHSLTELISNLCPHTPLLIEVRYQEFQEELIFSFESQELFEHHQKINFTSYAPLTEILELNRQIIPLSFGMCRSIAKFEGWILDLHEEENEKTEIRLRINASGRKKL